MVIFSILSEIILPFQLALRDSYHFYDKLSFLIRNAKDLLGLGRKTSPTMQSAKQDFMQGNISIAQFGAGFLQIASC